MNTVSSILLGIACTLTGILIGMLLFQSTLRYALQQWKEAIDMLRRSYEDGQKDAALEIHMLLAQRLSNFTIQGKTPLEVGRIFSSKLRGVMYEFASRNDLPTIVEDIRNFEKNVGKSAYIKSPMQQMPPRD